MQALVASAAAQGWAVDYANSNAIGTGSAGSPKFDTVAYASGASVGIMILKMPLGSLSTQWLVKIEVAWGTSAGAWLLKVTTATSQSGGVLTGAGSMITMGSASAAAISVEYWVGVHANEFVISLPNTWLIAVGRKRTLAGSYLDDIGLMSFASSSSFAAGYPAPVSMTLVMGGLCLVRNIAQGEYTSVRALSWGHVGGGTGYISADTMTDNSAAYGYPVAPFWMGNGPGGFPRTFAIFCLNDMPAPLNHFAVTVDGADRLFFVPATYAGMLIGNAKWAFAKE
jgi:hypothetical protein